MTESKYMGQWQLFWYYLFFSFLFVHLRMHTVLPLTLLQVNNIERSWKNESISWSILAGRYIEEYWESIVGPLAQYYLYSSLSITLGVRIVANDNAWMHTTNKSGEIVCQHRWIVTNKLEWLVELIIPCFPDALLY